MRKFIVDQILFLIFGIGIAIGIPFVFGFVFTWVLEILTILTWSYLCRQILLLPLDFICGATTRVVYFAARCVTWDYEFCKNRHYCEWKFYHGNRQKLILTVPVAKTLKELDVMVQPQADQKLKITYLRHSKILLNWETVQ